MWHRIKRIFRSFLPLHRKRSLGELGEAAAVKFLKKKKYNVIERNVTFDVGEIDIVAVDGRTVVFVEVKTRKSRQKGEPWEAVDLAKQKKISQAASIYLNKENLADQKSRFDIISITWLEGQTKPEIEHLIDAFEARVD